MFDLITVFPSSSSQSMAGSGGGVSGLTPAQQQLLAAAGTSLTSVSGGGGRKDFANSRSATPSSPAQRAGQGSDLSLSRPPQPATPTATPSLSQLPATNGALDPASQTKYQQLLSVIEEMSKDIRLAAIHKPRRNIILLPSSGRATPGPSPARRG